MNAAKTRSLLLSVLLCLGLCSARAFDESKPKIYSVRGELLSDGSRKVINFDTWGSIEMYSTATVVGKNANSYAFGVVAPNAYYPQSGHELTYQLIVTTQGYVGIGTASPAAQLDVNGTGAIKLPLGTTAERPANPAAGMARFNTTTGNFEVYSGTRWLVGGIAFSATGGTITDLGGYRIHTFTASGTLTVTGNVSVEVLVVAGGGGGGSESGGGGGAGGLVYNAAKALTTGTYTVTIGAGGSGGTSNNPGSAGGNSVFGDITAYGGGGGGGAGNAATSGGCGGGATGYTANSQGTGSQGYNGGNSAGGQQAGGGGGGTGAAGSDGTSSVCGNGGNGLSYSISGTATYYGGGGGSGCRCLSQTNSTGGLGGGGYGYTSCGTAYAGTAGTANTGGGGGGGSNWYGAGGAGGSGIVIVRYP